MCLRKSYRSYRASIDHESNFFYIVKYEKSYRLTLLSKTLFSIISFILYSKFDDLLRRFRLGRSLRFIPFQTNCFVINIFYLIFSY